MNIARTIGTWYSEPCFWTVSFLLKKEMNKALVANANFSEAQQHYSVQRAIQQTLVSLKGYKSALHGSTVLNRNILFFYAPAKYISQSLLHYRNTPILGGDKAPLSLLCFSMRHNTYPCCATYFIAILTAAGCSQGKALAKTDSQRFPWAKVILTELNTCAMLEVFLRWGGMRWSWYSQDDFYVVQSPLIMTCSVVTGLPPAQ